MATGFTKGQKRTMAARLRKFKSIEAAQDHLSDIDCINVSAATLRKIAGAEGIVLKRKARVARTTVVQENPNSFTFLGYGA